MSEPSAAGSSEAIKASMLLLAATFAALIFANTGLAAAYKSVLGTEIGFDVWRFDFSSSLKEWIKNALMAVFFVFVGLEIKAEFQEGALAGRSQAMLPFAGAAGGMAAPALIYLLLTPESFDRGWAIPTATDIAFALGVVGFLGKRVSAPLRAFLLALAVIDDLGAILVIALFYSGALKAWAVLGMALSIMALAAISMRNVPKLWPYLLAGIVLWIFTLQSGINATLAGVITALFVPLKADGGSPLHRLAHGLKTPVHFAIMPIFAFANAGVPLTGLGLADLAQPLTLGIALGLILGKPLGIVLAVFATVKLGFAVLPAGARWIEILAMACLAGIGFTMSLFVGTLAFTDEALINQVRLGVLGGSLVSALLGVGLILTAGLMLVRGRTSGP
ncbi:MAG: Na+/H+ antiporter NhaA [Beijerinckiaceae bacterium]